MSDLVNELKTRLKLEDLVKAAGVELKGRGRMLVGLCPMHNEKTGSFNVYADRQFFKCYGCGASGDVLSWIGFTKFTRLHSDGEEFIEVLREGCRLAGIEFEEKETGDRRQKTEAKRRLQSILTRFLEVAEAARTAEFYVRAVQRKGYLTQEVCERWRLGFSPSLKQCTDAGMSEKELASVGLLVYGEQTGTQGTEATKEQTPGRAYMFFRDSIVIPCIEGGSVVYLVSRRLMDHDRDGKPLEKSKKTLFMRSPDPKTGWGGVARPAGFNLDARYDAAAKLVGLSLVEAPLDAIAMSEVEHPAIGMMGNRPSVALCAML